MDKDNLENKDQVKESSTKSKKSSYSKKKKEQEKYIKWYSLRSINI